jgi:hypothetical protein
LDTALLAKVKLMTRTMWRGNEKEKFSESLFGEVMMTIKTPIAGVRTIAPVLIGMALICPAPSVAQTVPVSPTGKIRTYFIAADEIDRNYAPGGVNKMMGMKFDGYSKVFVEKGPIAVERCIAKRSTGSTRTRLSPQLRPRPAEWASY